MTGVQTCALPIYSPPLLDRRSLSEGGSPSSCILTLHASRFTLHAVSRVERSLFTHHLSWACRRTAAMPLTINDPNPPTPFSGCQGTYKIQCPTVIILLQCDTMSKRKPRTSFQKSGVYKIQCVTIYILLQCDIMSKNKIPRHPFQDVRGLIKSNAHLSIILLQLSTMSSIIVCCPRVFINNWKRRSQCTPTLVFFLNSFRCFFR